MTDYRLDKRELAELRAAHRQVRDVRAAYRINAVVLLGQGWSTEDVAGALLMDPETVLATSSATRAVASKSCCA